MRIAAWRMLGAALVVLGASLTIPVATAAAAGPVRILLVGDSITEGDTPLDTGYRCDLWNTLSAQYAIDFVGGLSKAGDCGGTFDPDHDGRGGATTAERIAEMNPNSFALTYEAALVHIGTNDQNTINFAWTQSYVSGTLEPTYRNLVAKLRQNNPTVTIYLSRLIPCGLKGDPGSGYLGCNVTLEGGLDNNGQPVEGMNDVWARIAGDSSTPQSPIILVDHWAGFNANSDLKPDQVHPNASGKAKIAAKWAQALAPQLSADDTADKVLLVEPNGRWHIRRPGQADRTFWYGTPGDVPLFGDWNGDGISTPGAWRSGPGGGYAYLTNTLPPDGGSANAEFFFYFGIPGDQVFVGDWNGDNRDTLGINRNGHIFLTNTNGEGGQPVPTNHDFWFGAPGDRAFGGDADGNGRDALFIYRSSDGFVYYTNQTPVGPAVIVADDFYFFGISSDRFVAGDWNEDGIDSAGIFRGSNTRVYLSNTNASGGAPAPTHIEYQWGSANWTPVAGRWQ